MPQPFLSTEWSNSVFLGRIEVFLGLMILLAAFWVMVNIPELSAIGTVFAVMVLIAGIFWAVDFPNEKNMLVETVGFGQNNRKALLAVGLGIAFAAILGLKFTGGIIPAFATTTTGALIAVFLAAPAEEYMFRGMLTPTLAKLLNNHLIGIGLSSVLFGAFHWFAYGAASGQIFTAIIFGVIASVGNAVLKTTTFSFSVHITWNAIATGLFGGFVFA